MVESSEEYKQVDKFIVTNKLLGKGAFGSVYKGFFKDNQNQVVAIKVIPLDAISYDKKYLVLLRREIEITKSIVHPNIVRMYGASRTQRNLYMFLEYCNDGDLKQLLKKNGGLLSESESALYIKQIIEGFKTLYKNSIIHRDIKPGNILLHEGVAKITDFGFARVIDCGKEEQANFSKVGTPLYMSPQILDDSKFSSKCDIWSLGMVFYEMLYGRTPWTGQSPYQLLQNIKKKTLQFDKKPVRSEIIKDLLRKMLVISDENRISWPELFQHEFLTYDQKITKNVEEAKEDDDDSFMKSVARNNAYLKQNKIMGYNKNMSAVGQNQSLNSTVSSNQTEGSHETSEIQVQTTDEYQKTMQKQEMMEENRKSIKKINSFFQYKRNIAIFINYASTKFFNFYSKSKTDKNLDLTEEFFYKIFFVFQKYQILLFKEIIDMMEGKQPTIFNQQQFQNYIKSKEYQETIDSINTDTQFMKPYFKEVLKRTQQIKSLKNMECIVNESLNDRDVFMKIYQELLKDFLKQMKKSVFGLEQNKDREFYLALKFTFICLEPQNFFKWDLNTQEQPDFHKIYEDYENIDDEQLIKEVKQIYQS